MKKIIIVALVLIGIAATAFKINTTIALRKKKTTATPVLATVASDVNDTLVGSGSVHRDSGIAFTYAPDNSQDQTYDFYVSQLTGSITACSMVLQGCNDTGSSFMTADWHTITGATAVCADCVGASSTTVPGTAKHYVWYVPHSSETFTWKRVLGDMTGTFTAIYTGKLTYSK